MIKYTDVLVTFAEIPDEISLCINISNCRNHCKGCHSPQLRENIGEELSIEVLDDLVKKNEGITCICFMGLGNDIKSLVTLICSIRENHPSLKIGIYSGNDSFDSDIIEVVDYYKIGHYDEKLGPINNPKSNQMLFKVTHQNIYAEVENITHKFWNKSLNN